MARRSTSPKAASINPYVELPGSLRQPLPNSRPAGPVNGSEIVSISVRTRPKQPIDTLHASVQSLYDTPFSERIYLTRAELAARHGASGADLDAIEQFAHTRNIIVSRRSAAERSLVLTGRLGDLLRAFPADLRLYHHAQGSYRGRSGVVKIPKAFDGIITGIFGYDTRSKHRAPHHSRPTAHDGPGGGNGVAATEFAKRYNFPTSHEGAALDGSGQCVAIIELGGGFRNSDLQLFFKEIQMPVPAVTSVSIDNAINRPSVAGSDDGEVMLDIQVAGAVAPKATFAIYFAPNQGSGFLDAINAAVHDSERNPSVISISWGGPEGPGDAQAAQAFHEVFTAAAALGVTICTAAGDHGVADEEAASWDKKMHVDHPSVDSMVLACGGTQIDRASGADVVWNDGTTFDPNTNGGGGWASGGGISSTVPVPDYQAAANHTVSLATGKPGRGVPDIAMSATNYFTRTDGSEGASGGTSAVAPLMAGLVALLNQAKGKNVGFLNKLLYAHPELCNPVTVGTNGIKGKIAGYQAGPGWNACAGLGTPNGTFILNAL